MARRQATVLFVDDELALLEDFQIILARAGHRVLATAKADEVMQIVGDETRIDVAVLDLQLPMAGCTQFAPGEAGGGRRLGLLLAQEVRRKFRRAPIIFWTGSRDRDLRARVLKLGNCRLISKGSGPDPVLDAIDHALQGFRAGERPCTFIVHGHDEATMQEVKRYLQDGLGFPEPIVLRDMPKHGKTVIEALEAYEHALDLAFVLLTPDDRAIPSGAPDAEVYRSRQNVIFEMGYFLGILGRNTGRVILLFRRPIELPSDIGGMIGIDITNGVEAADELIRREVSEWL